MNIYKWAEEYNYAADYYDPASGYIYKVQDYGVALRKLNEATTEADKAEAKKVVDAGIAVVDIDNGQLIGYARRAVV